MHLTKILIFVTNNTVWNEHYGTILSQSQIDYMLGKFQSKEAIEQQIAEGYEYYLIVDNRGRGAGSFVFEFLEQKARENSLKAIWLTVNKYNNKSISVYKHRGFETVRDQVAENNLTLIFNI